MPRSKFSKRGAGVGQHQSGEQNWRAQPQMPAREYRDSVRPRSSVTAIMIRKNAHIFPSVLAS